MFDDFKETVQQNAELIVAKEELEEKVKKMNKELSKMEDQLTVQK